MANGLDDFIKGATVLRQGIQDLSISTAVNNAQRQLTSINANITDENEKLAAMNQLATNFSLQLAQSGAPASQIQALGNSIRPPQVSPTVQAQIGEQQRSQSSRQRFAGAESERDRALKRELAKQKASQTAVGKPLSDKQVEAIIDLSSGLDSLADTVTAVRENPNLVGPIAGGFLPGLRELVPGQADFAVNRAKVGKNFQKFRKFITGAQAAFKELQVLEPLLPRIKDPVDVFLSKSEDTLEEMQRIMNKRIKVLKATGRDTSQIEGFVDEINSKLEQIKAGSAAPGVTQRSSLLDEFTIK